MNAPQNFFAAAKAKTFKWLIIQNMATIHILKERATQQQIREMLEAFPDMRMIKIVVDIENDILAGGSNMHYECEQILLDKGSGQENLWGANWYPDEQGIEFESLINIRPRQNRNIIIQDKQICKEVERITRKHLGDMSP